MESMNFINTQALSSALAALMHYSQVYKICRLHGACV